VDTPACRLCFNAQANKTYLVREMMFGTKDEFTYLECSSCGCLQLINPPTSLQKYYPPHYYSFGSDSDSTARQPSVRSFARKLRNRAYLADSVVLTSILGRVAPYEQFRAFSAARPSRKSRILDVGCGAGHLLKDIVELGFRQARGIDPFLNSDVTTNNGLHVQKCSLEGLEGTTWDLIMFHHSFEHVPDPVATLQTAANLLSECGCCVIRIPVTSWAWRAYGVHWVEIEAPRHFFLHTKRSMGLLAERAGLRIARIEYDSDAFEVWGSELYRRDIPLSALKTIGDPREFFSATELRRFGNTVRDLNERGEAGRAAFYLFKS
jgi:SAM-dependent methyltransferase